MFRIAVALSATLLSAAGIEAQPRPVRPDVASHYAIVDARLVTVSGGTIDRGTIVVRDGVIVDLGRDVTVPEGARRIDGTGMTVYPGLIDAMTTLGQEAESAPNAERPHSWGPEDRPGTTSWLSAAEDLDGDDERFSEWREAGFTTVVSTRPGGLVTGQAAVLDVGSFDHPRETVVETPVAMRLNLRSNTYTGYPASLLGSFAYLKQLYLDAHHYGDVWDAYDADPRGKPRPEWDLALEPVRRQLREGWPVLFPANSRTEVGRAIATSSEMGVRPIVYGLSGAYEAADLLAEAGVPALVSLDWPTAPDEIDATDPPPLRMLRLVDRAPTTPSALAAAGVDFAFYTDGLDADEAVDAVRHAVAQGLDAERALRALTLTAAEIFRVDDRLGSLEVGKIANLVVTEGDLLDGGSVEMVFVDGDRFAVEASPGGDERAADDEEEELARAPIPMEDDRGPYRDDPVTFISNATILTASHGRIDNGDLLIRDGHIAELGPDLIPPDGARVVDATGLFLTPGIIDAHSHMAASAINEGAVNVSAMVQIEDVIDPTDVDLYRALAGGVTTINVLHGSANPIGGGNAVIKLRWGADAPDLLVGAPPGIKFALGENTTRDRNPDRYPATRMGVQDVIRQALLDASEYMREWDAWESGDRSEPSPRRDLKLESLAQVLRGERWVHAHSYRADEILQLIRVADEFGFTIRTFQHVLEGYKVADEIAAHGAGASTFSDWWAYKVEAYDAIPYNAALMTERGVLVSINSDSEEEVRHLNQEAAKSMKWGGMEEEPALRLVTLNPAIQLGIDDRTGSLDVGKDADLVLFDEYPLSMFAKPVQTYVDGKLYFDIELDRERRDALAEERDALVERYGGDR